MSNAEWRYRVAIFGIVSAVGFTVLAPPTARLYDCVTFAVSWFIGLYALWQMYGDIR